MARRRRKPIDSNVDDVSTPPGVLTYTITNSDYTGEIFIKYEWTWDDDVVVNLGLQDASGLSAGVQRAVSCQEFSYNGQYFQFPHPDNGEAETSKVWYDNDKINQLCFNAYVHAPGANNVDQVTAGTLTVTSYTDEDCTNEVGGQDASTKEYVINIAASTAFFIPFYSCEPRASLGQDGGGNPVYSPGDNACHDDTTTERTSPVIWMRVDPNNDPSTAVYPENSAGGTIVSMNLSADTGGVNLKEYYMSGKHTTSAPDSQEQINFNDPNANYSPPVNNARFATTIKKIQDSSQVTSRGFLRPGAASITKEGGSGCESCRGKSQNKQALWMIDSHQKTLADFGFSTAFTGVAFSGAKLQHATDPTGAVATGDEQVVWTKSVSAAFKKEEAFTIPNGMGTRVAMNGNLKLSVPEEDYEIRVKPAQFWYHIERAATQQWKLHRLIKGTLRRDLNLPDGGYFQAQENGEVWVFDNLGNRVRDAQSLTVQELEMAVTDIFTTQNVINIGIQKSDLYKFGINYQTTATISNSQSEVDGSTSVSETWSADFTANFRGLMAWIAQAPGSAAINDAQDFDAWKSGVFNVNVDMGSGGQSQSSQWVNATSIEPDGEVKISDTIAHRESNREVYGDGPDTEITIKSISMDYTATIVNGWDFAISGINANKLQNGEWDITSPSDWNYTVGGELKDDIRWVVEKTSGGIKLGIGTSIDLVDKYLKDNPKGGRLIGPRGLLKKSTMNIGLICDNHNAGKLTFTPRASIQSDVANFQHAINLVDGSQTISKTFQKCFSGEQWPSFLSGDDDSFEMNFFVRADNNGHQAIKEGEWDALAGGWTSNMGADATLQKTLVEFGEIGGRLAFTGTIKANYTPGVSNGGAQFGWSATGTIVWENNVLEWFGMPFNLHPGITAFGAGTFQFGGYLPPGSKGKDLIDDVATTAEYSDGASVKFGIGAVTWNFVMVDTFRQHLRKKHNSVFRYVGLGQCPILNKLGSAESIWAYMMRVGPINALAAIGEATQICAQKRKVYFERYYNRFKATNLKMKAIYRAMNGGIGFGNRWGAPICGSHTKVNNSFLFSNTVRNSDSFSNKNEEKVEEKWEPAPTGDTAAGRFPSTNLYPRWYQQLANDAQIDPPLPYNQNMDPWDNGQGGGMGGNPYSPFPCILTNYQLAKAANVMTMAYDKSNSRCACVEIEFYKLARDKYRNNYDFNKFSDELSGTDDAEDGFITRGLNKIDGVVLQFVLRTNLSPVDDSTKVGSNTTPLGSMRSGTVNGVDADGKPTVLDYECKSSDTAADCFSKIMKTELTNIANQVGVANDSEVRAEIQEWKAGSSWWKDQGICGGLYTIIRKIVGVVGYIFSWVPLLGSLFKEKAQKQPIIDALYDKTNPCTVPSGSGGGGGSSSTDECFQKYIFWRYYVQAYAPTANFLAKSLEDSSELLSNVITTKYVSYSTNWRGGHSWGNWWNNKDPLPFSTLTAAQASNFTARDLASSTNFQLDLLKIYMIHQAGVGGYEEVAWQNYSEFGTQATTVRYNETDQTVTIGGTGFKFKEVLAQNAYAEPNNELDVAQEFATRFKNANAAQFCSELYKYIGFGAVTGGPAKSKQSIEVLQEGPCDQGYTGDQKTELSKIDALWESTTKNSFVDDGLTLDANPGTAGTYYNYLNGKDASYKTANKQANSLDNSNLIPRSNSGLGSDRALIIGFIRDLLSDPALNYVSSEASIANELWASDANAGTLYTYFDSLVQGLNTAAGSNTASNRKIVGTRLHTYETYLKTFQLSNSTADPFLNKVKSRCNDYLLAIRHYFKGLCLKALCDADIPISTLAYIDNDGTNLGPGKALQINNDLTKGSLGNYCQLIYTTIYGSNTTGSEYLPDFQSLRGGHNTDWNYEQYHTMSAVSTNWTNNNAVSSYARSALVAIVKDPYVKSCISKFSPNLTLIGGTLNETNRTANISNLAAALTDLKTAPTISDIPARLQTVGVPTYYKLGDHHWSMLQALYHATQNMWQYPSSPTVPPRPTGADAKATDGIQILLYNCLGSTNMNTVPPWYTDPFGTVVRGVMQGGSFTIKSFWSDTPFRGGFTFLNAHSVNLMPKVTSTRSGITYENGRLNLYINNGWRKLVWKHHPTKGTRYVEPFAADPALSQTDGYRFTTDVYLWAY